MLGCPTGTASSRIRAGLEQVRAGLAPRGVALGAVEASLAAWSGEVLARPVPAAPSLEAIVARAGTRAASFALPGKKVVFFLLAAALVGVGVSELVLPNLGSGPAPGVVGRPTVDEVPLGTETRGRMAAKWR